MTSGFPQRVHGSARLKSSTFLALLLPAFVGGNLLCCARAPARPQVPAPWRVYADTWGAVDGLGRVLPSYSQCGLPHKDAAVGIFYFIANNHPTTDLYDNDKIIAQRNGRPNWWRIGPLHTSHWWGEPLFGYYRSSDPWVLKEHAAMLADAGIDTLILDNTNGPTYPHTQKSLFKAFAHLRQLGEKTPYFCCFCRAKAWNTDYRDIYAKGLASSLWYRWQGKPLLLIHSSDKMQGNILLRSLPATIRTFFTLRYSWALVQPDGRRQTWFGNGHNVWPWIAYYPQPFGWHGKSSIPESLSVTVGGWAVSDLARDYHDHHLPPRKSQKPALGFCFAEQWKQALAVRPHFVFVTGWNEWTAGCWPCPAPDNAMRMVGHPIEHGGPIYVDEFDAEYSRDCEPMKGGFGDDYYYQLIANVRLYKGVHKLAFVQPRTIHISQSFSQWATVGPEFRNQIGLPVHRNYAGWGGHHYIDQSGRNDIKRSKMTFDARHLYFYAQTVQPLTACTEPDWMLLFLDADNNPKTGWLGYDYLINRRVPGSRTDTIARYVGPGYRWKTIGTVRMRTKGNQLQLSVSRKLLGLGDSLPKELHFKWADNIRQNGKWSDFYLHGDCAPPFRFYYRAKFPYGTPRS
ncbi:MAG: hypothetical protein HKL96_01505 [Phycisphaerales bacterium]|nr:hypothetical protein [Phycisphaerales bacterium]